MHLGVRNFEGRSLNITTAYGLAFSIHALVVTKGGPHDLRSERH